MAAKRLVFLIACLLVSLPLLAADSARTTVYSEKELLSPIARSLASSFETVAIPAEGSLQQHPILVDGYDIASLGDVSERVKTAYESGQAVVIIDPAPESQSFLDDITGGEINLPDALTARPTYLGEPRLAAIAIRRAAGTAAETAEFWVTFDGDDGTEAEEKAEDDRLVASIAEWLRETPPAPAPPPSTAARKPVRRAALKAEESKGRAAIDALTSAVVRKVSFSFDKGSMATVVKSWAAYSAGQDEDWYIFELTTTSQPLNFATWSDAGVDSPWEQNDKNCKGIVKTGCKRERYATKVQVKLVPKTPGLELVFYGPDSDRAQDEYSYSSKFSLGGKVTAGYDDKGPKAGVELSGGAEFTRSTKVTIKDATLFAISNPAVELAGWRFDMPQMRAVNDLTPYGGPSMSCDNLLQMPYPIQQAGMEGKQFAIYRLPAEARSRVKGIELAVSLMLEESTSEMRNWTAKYCNIFNCNCSPDSWVHKTNELKDTIISFPLAAH